MWVTHVQYGGRVLLYSNKDATYTLSGHHTYCMEPTFIKRGTQIPTFLPVIPQADWLITSETAPSTVYKSSNRHTVFTIHIVYVRDLPRVGW